MHVLASASMPTLVPVTTPALAVFSMNDGSPASTGTWNGNEPGVHGVPVLCGSFASVTAWHVVQYTAATFAWPAYVDSVAFPFDEFRYSSSPYIKFVTPASPLKLTLPATRCSIPSIAWQLPHACGPVHDATSPPLRLSTY